MKSHSRRLPPDLPPQHQTIKLELDVTLDNTLGESPASLVVTTFPGRQYDQSGRTDPGYPLPTIPPNTSAGGPPSATIEADAPARSVSPPVTQEWDGPWDCCCVTIDVYDTTLPNAPVRCVTYGAQGVASQQANKRITGVKVEILDAAWSSRVTLTFFDHTTRVASQDNNLLAGTTADTPFNIQGAGQSVLQAPTPQQRGQGSGPTTQNADTSSAMQLWMALPTSTGLDQSTLPRGVYQFFVPNWTSVGPGVNPTLGCMAWEANPVQPNISPFPGGPAPAWYFLAIAYQDTPGLQLVIWCPAGGLNDGFAFVGSTTPTPGMNVMYLPPDTGGVNSYWVLVTPPAP